jgi:hypothetical protein
MEQSGRSKTALVAAVVVLAAASFGRARSQEQAEVALREVEAQVVLYTVYRGPYDQVGSAISKLFAQAGPKGVFPAGSITFAYLNSPELTPAEHLLTEIRVPVAETALGLAGTLGDFTDVKKMPAVQLAVVHKPLGVGDPSGLRRRLYAWLHENGYHAMDTCQETFLSHGGTSYAQMESEIAVPVRKLAAE